jgi:hypothetical protein
LQYTLLAGHRQSSPKRLDTSEADARYRALLIVDEDSRIPKARGQQVSSTLATAIHTVVVLAMAWLIVAGRGELAQFGGLSPQTWLLLRLSGEVTGLP